MPEFVYEIEGKPQRYRFTGSEVTLGRSSDNNVGLNDFAVSRRHAVVRREGNAWVINDQNSTNGVKVNGRFVTNVALTPGDVVTIGTFTLGVREEVAAPVAYTPHLDMSSTVIRSIADFNRDFGLDPAAVPSDPAIQLSGSGRRLTPAAARGKIFEILV